jgi:hypothetical protein
MAKRSDSSLELWGRGLFARDSVQNHQV